MFVGVNLITSAATGATPRAVVVVLQQEHNGLAKVRVAKLPRRDEQLTGKGQGGGGRLETKGPSDVGWAEFSSLDIASLARRPQPTSTSDRME